MKIKILIIEDEETIRTFIETTLKTNGYTVIIATHGKEALTMIPSHCPDLILLDLGLPDMDGLCVLKEMRQLFSIPVIVVSARGEEEDKVEALDMGADDYIMKPFGTSELLARIRTALRHSLNSSKEMSGTIFKAKDLTIDFQRHLVLLKGKELHLTQIEYKLVALLAQSAGSVLTYDHMITQLWGPYAIKDNQILRVNMANIRRKLEENPATPQYISTEVGIGYRMIEN